MSTPVDQDDSESVSEDVSISHSDERASLEEELARLDARWERRTDPEEITELSDSTLDELEDSLDGIDL